MPEHQCFIRNNYIILISPDGEYQIELNRINDANKVLAWIHHLADKVWVTPKLLKMLIVLACEENKIVVNFEA